MGCFAEPYAEEFASFELIQLTPTDSRVRGRQRVAGAKRWGPRICRG